MEQEFKVKCLVLLNIEFQALQSIKDLNFSSHVKVRFKVVVFKLLWSLEVFLKWLVNVHIFSVDVVLRLS